MTFQGIEFFLTIYQEKSITAAAQKLYITQQCCSDHLQRLEKELGVQLFVRRPKLIPTYAGDRLAKAASDLLRQRKEIFAEMNDLAQYQKGKITFGAPHSFACDVAPRILEHFYKQYPYVSIQIINGATALSEERTLNGELDFYVGYGDTPEPNLSQLTLFSAHPMLIMSKAFFRSYFSWTTAQIETALKTGVDLSVLSDIPMALPRKGWKTRTFIDSYLKENNIALNIVLEATQQITILSIRRSICAGILYPLHLPHRNSENEIYFFPIKCMDYSIDYHLGYRKDHYFPTFELYLIDLIKQYADQYKIQNDVAED